MEMYSNDRNDRIAMRRVDDGLEIRIRAADPEPYVRLLEQLEGDGLLERVGPPPAGWKGGWVVWDRADAGGFPFVPFTPDMTTNAIRGELGLDPLQSQPEGK